jgi:uncharacterized membrane protein YdjX (TVP38/TMEM64 family)
MMGRWYSAVKEQRHQYLWLKWCSAAVLLIFAIGIGQILQRIDLVWIDDLKPDPLLCLLLIGMLYLVKALTMVVVPSALVYLLTGLLFPTGVAMVIILLGLSGEFILNYYMGRRFGRRQVRRLTNYLVTHSDRIHRLSDRQLQCDPLTIFLLRFLPGPPNNVTSLLLGSSDDMELMPYLWPSLLGALPKAATVTLSGTAILDPLSWQFLLPNALFGAAVILIFLWYRHHQSIVRQLAADEIIEP